MLDLNDVALFIQVVQGGSFAEAARRLAMPRNTVSRRVQELEEHLGVRLMQRTTRRLALTDAGHTFYRQCADQVEALTQSAQELIDGSQLPSGKVRIAAPADFFNWFPMEWVAEFLAAHTRVRMEFVLSDARADLIGEGIDMAFRAGQALEPHLVARQISTSRLAMVASPAYLAARGVPATLADLASHDCLTLPKSSGQSAWRLDGPQGEVEIELSGRFYANTAQALVKATLAGLGVALLPSVMTAAYIEAGQLMDVLPEYGIGDVGIYVVYLSRRQLPRAVSAFIDFSVGKMLDEKLLNKFEPCKERASQPSGKR